MPAFRFNKVFEKARRVHWFLRNPKKALKRRLSIQENALRRRHMRSKRDAFKQLRSEVKSRRQEEYSQLKTEIAKIENKIKYTKREIKLIGQELRAAKDPAQRSEIEERSKRLKQEKSRLRAELRAAKEKGRAANIGRKKTKKMMQQEIFQLEKQRRAETEHWTVAGALPDFVIIGGKKCGTTYLYHLLAQHPLVEPAAKKELHFFDIHFDLGIEWYRQCFPAPRWEDGRRTITGEASPYMAHRYAPERMAQVIPEARLIALLRNPVERAYSDYQMVARKDREHKTFEEAIGAAVKAWASGGRDAARADVDDARHKYLSRGIYVDRLLRWTKYFSKEQMLVLKSEDLFEDPRSTLQTVFDFLDLPEWEPPAEVLLGGKRNEGSYEQEMDPATRRRLEEYFEPHNQRLYEFLGVDFGW